MKETEVFAEWQNITRRAIGESACGNLEKLQRRRNQKFGGGSTFASKRPAVGAARLHSPIVATWIDDTAIAPLHCFHHVRFTPSLTLEHSHDRAPNAAPD